MACRTKHNTELLEGQTMTANPAFHRPDSPIPIQATSLLGTVVAGIAQPLTPSDTSMLGRVYGAIALYLLRPQLALLGLIAPDYVLHSLDEFRAYKSARIDRTDEPLFALIEHKVSALALLSTA